jgi:hypothetical protein
MTNHIDQLPRIQSGNANIELLLERLRIADAANDIPMSMPVLRRTDERRAIDEAWRNQVDSDSDSETEADIELDFLRNRDLASVLDEGHLFTGDELNDIQYGHRERDLFDDQFSNNPAAVYEAGSPEWEAELNAFRARYTRAQRDIIYARADIQRPPTVYCEFDNIELDSDLECSETESDIDDIELAAHAYHRTVRNMTYENNRRATAIQIRNETNPTERGWLMEMFQHRHGMSYEYWNYLHKDEKVEDPLVSDEQYEQLVANNLGHLRVLEENYEIAQWA